MAVKVSKKRLKKHLTKKKSKKSKKSKQYGGFGFDGGLMGFFGASQDKEKTIDNKIKEATTQLTNITTNENSSKIDIIKGRITNLTTKMSQEQNDNLNTINAIEDDIKNMTPTLDSASPAPTPASAPASAPDSAPASAPDSASPAPTPASAPDSPPQKGGKKTRTKRQNGGTKKNKVFIGKPWTSNPSTWLKANHYKFNKKRLRPPKQAR